jgi:hypothetical protein
VPSQTIRENRGEGGFRNFIWLPDAVTKIMIWKEFFSEILISVK